MNKKLFAAVFSTVLLCSCGNGGTAEVPETTAESVAVTSAASEEAVTTTAIETASELVSEVSETEEKAPITRDFFNDDVVFEEVMLPVKFTNYIDETEDRVTLYEYDAAGNIICEDDYTTYEYDYNPDGTYNSIIEYYNGKWEKSTFYDKNGCCVKETNIFSTEDFEYKFDSEGRLIYKSMLIKRDGEKENSKFYREYTYDEAGRLYEEIENDSFNNFSRFKHEYNGNIENVYYFINEELFSSTTYEYEGDKLKRKTTGDDEVWEYLYDEKDRLVKKIYPRYDNRGYIEEYCYRSDGSMKKQTYDTGGIIQNEVEYAMIPKIKTDIEYKYFDQVEP